MDIFSNDVNLILRTRAKKPAEGETISYKDVSEVRAFTNQFGPYLGSLNEGAKYFISPARDKGPRKPELVLRVSGAVGEKSTVICGLFHKKYDDGSEVYKGTSLETGEQYLLGKPFAKKEAPSQMTDDSQEM